MFRKKLNISELDFKQLTIEEVSKIMPVNTKERSDIEKAFKDKNLGDRGVIPYYHYIKCDGVWKNKEYYLKKIEINGDKILVNINSWELVSEIPDKIMIVALRNDYRVYKIKLTEPVPDFLECTMPNAGKEPFIIWNIKLKYQNIKTKLIDDIREDKKLWAQILKLK